MASNTSAYSGGVIQETCPSCGAKPNERCKKKSGFGTHRAMGPHKARIKRATETSEKARQSE